MALHPLDFAALKKGEIIGREQLEDIFGFSYDAKPDGYRFAVLGLQGQIEQERPDLLTRGVNNFEIEVLDDFEAERYLRKRLAALVAALARITGRRVRIDRAEFEEPVKRASESLDRTYQGIALMARAAHRNGVRMAGLFLKPASDAPPAKELPEKGEKGPGDGGT